MSTNRRQFLAAATATVLASTAVAVPAGAAPSRIVKLMEVRADQMERIDKLSEQWDAFVTAMPRTPEPSISINGMEFGSEKGIDAFYRVALIFDQSDDAARRQTLEAERTQKLAELQAAKVKHEADMTPPALRQIEAEQDKLWAEVTDLEAAIVRGKAESMADLAAKARLLAEWSAAGNRWDEMDVELAATLARDIEALAMVR